MSSFELVLTAPRGAGDLLVGELSAWSLAGKLGNDVVRFSGTLADAYRVCLWTRVGSRVLLPLASFPAPTPEALYEGVRALPWSEHLATEGTLAVDFSSHRSQITHTHFGALKVKDAVVDALRRPDGTRPSVDTERPDVRVNVRLANDIATISIDLSGDGLHRRGYREEGVAAPLKENLAATILLRSRWPEAAREGRLLYDPMCGSGTLLIEAGLMARDIAPGLLRSYWGFLGWRGHDARAWQALRAEAEERKRAGESQPCTLVGSDADARAVAVAKRNVARAGLSEVVQVSQRELRDIEPPAPMGMVVTNPPYGERLGDKQNLVPLYRELGQVLKQRFAGYSAHVLTSDEELSHAIGLRSSRENSLFNGALACTLAHYTIKAARQGEEPRAPALTQSAPMFKNRLAKNKKQLEGWAKREGVTCYRLYDADMPEYAVAVDWYEGFVHVQEYAPPKSIDPKAAEARLTDVIATIPEVLEIPPERVFSKVRRKQKGLAQYEKQDTRGELTPVHEGGHTFLVNLSDYLDTGLFLDHRITRKRVGELARGQRFLNLFCYTASASVYAAKAGARHTVSVDLSHTYLDWARENFHVNQMKKATNELVHADCRVFLRECDERFGVIFLDPPTFSNSKRMDGTLDIQRDHTELINGALRLLSPGGVLVFSTNFRRFRLDQEALSQARIEDITAATIPHDFARNPKIHACYLIRQA